MRYPRWCSGVLAVVLLFTGTVSEAQTPRFPNWAAARIALSREAAALPQVAVPMPTIAIVIPGQKSAIAAGFLSLIVPGLGEYYVGDQVWRGMIFSGLEIGGWLERAYWNKRGDDSTTAFRGYGDTHWSPDSYGAYMNKILIEIGVGPVALHGDHRSINAAEDSLRVHGIQDFTHTLTFDDLQQYYELISKYIQYRSGWDDFVSIDIYPPNDERHANMRANMNYQYGVADYFLYGIIANHVLSAIDAALLARDHNANLHIQGMIQSRQLPDGTLGYIPTAKLSVTF